MARVAEYLVDKSALGRLAKPNVRAALGPIIQVGKAAVCGVVELEMLYSARNVAEHDRTRTYLQAFEWLAVFEECWDRPSRCTVRCARPGAIEPCRWRIC
jgi:predicted nucleic acid-binding protein